LTALDSTRAEIIVPILDDTGDQVIGTIDVESEHLNAFYSKAQALLEESANVLTKFWASGN
jgi:putative methionine-R-sulfoxide reductase with GAF domain